MAKKSSALAGMSLAQINAEVRRREQLVGKLVRRREALVKKIADLNATIRDHGGSVSGGPAAGGRKRPKNEMQLVDALKAALSGKEMSVTEVADAVQKAGYQTSSANFRTIVNQTLINNLKKGGFKRTGRGMYTAM